MTRWILTLFTAVSVYGATILPMDSARGLELFTSEGCSQCHALNGQGGKVGPDLARVLDRDFTPSALAGTMWNHAPAMWQTLKDRNFNTGTLSAEAASNIVAAFYAARYFERPGDAGRGKKTFTDKCEKCHGLSNSKNQQAPPVTQWQTMSDPVALVGAMWNHAPAMWVELEKKTSAWPKLSPEELSDLLVYVRSVNPSKAKAGQFHIRVDDEGEKLFVSKGCQACHLARPIVARDLTLTAMAADMWGHASFLRVVPPRLSADEMSSVLGYFWAKQFFEPAGDPGRGRRIFTQKRCNECHSGKGPGPDLAAANGDLNGITMISLLWRHGTAMLGEMKQRNIPWPVFRAGEMADLMTYLNQVRPEKK